MGTYLGQGPFKEFSSSPTKDVFTGDGSTTTFDLGTEVVGGGEFALEVFIDNVRQEPGSGKAFTLGVDGSNATKRLTFASAPASGSYIYCINDKTNLTSVAPLQNDLNGTELVLDGDGDTSITADTDDRIDFRISDADHLYLGTSSGDTTFKIAVDTKDFIFQQFDGRNILEINDAGYVALANGATGPGQLRLYEDTDNGTNYTALQVGTQSGDITYTLPTADGSSGYRLETNGSGTLSWAAPGHVTLANSTNNRVMTSVDSSNLNSEANLTFDGSTLAVTGAATVSTTLGVTGATTLAGAVQINNTITLGADDQGYDVILYGDTASANVTWDTDVDDLILNGGARIVVPESQLVLGSTAVTSTAAELNLLDGVSGLVQADLTKLAAVDATAAEINLIDGGTARGTTAVASGDGILINDGGTMRMTNVDTVSTYFASHTVGGTNIVTTGALGAGSIAAGFGAIDNGTSGIRSDTITAETAFVPDASGGADLGTTSLEFNDAFFNDAAVINFGDDQDVTLTHVHNTGLLLNSTMAIQFNDASQYINAPSNAILDINATDEIELNATAIDINGTADVSGAFTAGSTIVATGSVTGTTINATGDTSASDNAAIGYTSAEGLILTGQGSTSDITVKNDADATVFTVPTGTDDILFPDSAQAQWGASSDLVIYHDGSNSYIKEQGTGNLDITSNGANVSIMGKAGENSIIATGDGTVELYYDNSKKFETTSAGATVTGVLTATLQANAIDSDHYVDGSIDNAHIADDAIDSEHYATGSIDTAHLGDSQVTNAKIATNAITSGNITALHVTGAKLALDRRSAGSGDDVYSGNQHDYAFYDASVGISWFTANAEEMRLEDDGDLHVDGDVIAYSTTVSDATLKYNINPVEFALDKINQLNGVTFNYFKNDKESAGLLAQDVEKVMPSAVSERRVPLHTGDDKLYKTLHYDSMTAILVEAIKELTAKVKKLEEK